MTSALDRRGFIAEPWLQLYQSTGDTRILSGRGKAASWTQQKNVFPYRFIRKEINYLEGNTYFILIARLMSTFLPSLNMHIMFNSVTVFNFSLTSR